MDENPISRPHLIQALKRSALSSLSLFLQSPCLPANIPTCQHTLHSINSGPTPCLRNDAEIKPILSTSSFHVFISTSSLLPSSPYCSPLFSITSVLDLMSKVVCHINKNKANTFTYLSIVMFRKI